MFKGIVTKIARDMWESAGKPETGSAAQNPVQAQAAPPVSDSRARDPADRDRHPVPVLPGRGYRLWCILPVPVAHRRALERRIPKQRDLRHLADCRG